MDKLHSDDKWILDNLMFEKYNRYKSLLFQIAFSYLGNKHDCEDVLQEAFIRLYYQAPNFTDDEDERRWVIRITINLCKNQLKSFWRRKRISIDGLDEYAYTQEEKSIMYEIIRLPDKYKIIIQLYYIAGYKISEIAQTINLTESAVKMRLKRARELLKVELDNSDY